MIRMTWYSFHVVVFNWCPCDPLTTLLVSQTRRCTFEMSPCDTSVILWLAWFSLWSNIVICIQRQLNVEYNKYKCDTLPMKQFGKSVFTRKEVDQDWKKWWSTIKIARGFQEVFYILSVGFSWNWFPLALGQSGRASRVIPLKWRAVYNKLCVCDKLSKIMFVWKRNPPWLV